MADAVELTAYSLDVAANPHRAFRPVPFAFAALMPLATFTALDLPSAHPRPAPTTEVTVALVPRTRVVVSAYAIPPPPPPVIRVPQASIPVVLPELDFERLEFVLGVGVMPARPLSNPDPGAFAARAGLRVGEGATVVFRVHVLISGEVGDLVTEISSGSDAVDAAAAEYVRALEWMPGRIDGRPQGQWVRWGVRLEG
jgi:TonB family protein